MANKKTNLVDSCSPGHFDENSRLIIVVAIAIILPFILIVLEKMAMLYPARVEELCKAIVIYFIILPMPAKVYRELGAFLFGLIFALSENIFYLSDFITKGNLDLYWQRFLWPLPMHILTAMVIVWLAGKNKNMILVATLLAIGIHYFYNNYFINFLVNLFY